MSVVLDPYLHIILFHNALRFTRVWRLDKKHKLASQAELLRVAIDNRPLRPHRSLLLACLPLSTTRFGGPMSSYT